LVVVGDSQRRALSVVVELAFDAKPVLADDVAVEPRLGRVLSRHRATFVPLLENVVGERVPEEIGLGHDYTSRCAIRRSAL
jgi:hypothetical protein